MPETRNLRRFLVSGINGADSWFLESMVKMVQWDFSLIMKYRVLGRYMSRSLVLTVLFGGAATTELFH
jgi:hypothetical protein